MKYKYITIKKYAKKVFFVYDRFASQLNEHILCLTNQRCSNQMYVASTIKKNKNY